MKPLRFTGIKIYRERFGSGLKEAKEAVEALMSGTNSHVPRETRRARVPTPETLMTEHPEVLELIRSGEIIQAIKLLRQETGAGLKEAKDLVDSVRGD